MDTATIPPPSAPNVRPLHPSIAKHYDQYAIIDWDGEPRNDFYVHQHQNGLCIVGLARSHFLVQQGDRYQVHGVKFPKAASSGSAQADKKLSGRRKRGAKVLSRDALLCEIEYSERSPIGSGDSGTEDQKKMLAVRAMIHGKLIELNERLLEDPQLVAKKPLGAGFIAILDPNVRAFSNSKNAANELLASKKQREILRSMDEWLQARPEFRPADDASRVFVKRSQDGEHKV